MGLVLSNEIKAKIFSLYLGQWIYRRNDYDETIYPVDGGMLFDNGYLTLRDVKQLTDGELITVASLVCARHNRHYKPEEITYKIHDKRRFDIIVIVSGIARYMVQLDSDGVGFVDYYMGGAGRIHHFAPGQFAVTDYLRSIGIALPITLLVNGDVRTIGVEEQIESGVIKIQE